MGRLTEKPCPGNCGDLRPRRADQLCYQCQEAIRKWSEQEEQKKQEAKLDDLYDRACKSPY